MKMDKTQREDGIKRAKAPWRLTGDAYVVALKMPDKVLDEQSFVPESLKGRRLGSHSRMIYVDYKNSPVGPYRELLFDPGRFLFEKRPCRTISRIFVSTPESVVNGLENWGIPKRIAEFETQTLANGWEHITVSAEGAAFAELTFSTVRFGVPFSDRWLPATFRVTAQHYREQCYIYAPITRAKMKMGRLRESKIDPRMFPDISRGRFALCVRLENFRMRIPAATILPITKR